VRLLVIGNLKIVLAFLCFMFVNSVFWEESERALWKFFPPFFFLIEPLKVDVRVAFVSSKNAEIFFPVFALLEKTFVLIVFLFF
jgi:hypothetical protein